MIAGVLGALLPCAVVAVWLVRLGGRRALAETVALAVGLGFGAASFVWWGLMWLPLATPRAMVIADAIVWLAIGAAAFVARPRAETRPAASHRSGRGAILAASALLLPLAALAVASFAGHVSIAPHGEWDAWDVWNSRARFLLRGYPSGWQDAFSPLVNWFRPHYPLLLPLTVARGWTSVGSETTVVPIAIAAAFSLATVVLVAGGLAARQGAAWGLIAAAIVLASPRFVTYAAWQFADIPLGFYIVATFVLIQRACESDRPRRWWILAGLAAGCAAWIKNEGTVFAVVALAVVGVWSLRRASGRSAAELGWLTLGALPGLLAVATFKIWLAPEDDYVRPLSVAWIASHIVDTARWLAVGEAFGRELWFNGAAMVGALPLLVVFVAICGIARPVAAAPLLCAATVLLVLAADALVYVITPFPLEWHLGTSLARVLTQLWPALVWIGLLSARRL